MCVCHSLIWTLFIHKSAQKSTPICATRTLQADRYLKTPPYMRDYMRVRPLVNGGSHGRVPAHFRTSPSSLDSKVEPFSLFFQTHLGTPSDSTL